VIDNALAIGDRASHALTLVGCNRGAYATRRIILRDTASLMPPPQVGYERSREARGVARVRNRKPSAESPSKFPLNSGHIQ
jgi:hypothetical protein